MTQALSTSAQDMSRYWMPFTDNRGFAEHPVNVVGAKGMHYILDNGERLLDGVAGLWCCNAGHNHPRIVEAICKQARELDYSSNFGLGHPAVFAYTQALGAHLPGNLGPVFLTNSGSEAVDTALKIALAYHHSRGQGQRTRIIGRQRGYHGMGFGGLSAAGMGPHKKQFGPMLAGAAHLPHTHLPARNAFSVGQPEHGADLADALLDMIATYDASTIAAVIVEPVAGSTGVLVPPKGYLERLRQITAQHGIVLIFDEVVTGFGRLGAPFASTRLGIEPDMIAMAKGINSGAVPMGGVAVSHAIRDAIFDAAAPGAVELSHGYTYSGHPLASAAALAALTAYTQDGIWDNAREVESSWHEAMHSLRRAGPVSDIRTFGLLAGIELGEDMTVGKPMAQAVYRRCFELGVLVRPVANTIVLSPPLVIKPSEIAQLTDALSTAISAL